MQFVANGPDIPLEILTAQEEGRLVLFCGAGISVPAQLPLFKDLVTLVYQALRTQPEPDESRELEARAYDRVLNLLEARFSAKQLRKEVRQILSPSDPPLTTHRAIVDLGTNRDDRVRVVTTNFDRLFYLASPATPSTAAPLIPVPKPHKWNSLVYLHGWIDDQDPDGQHLVLTSADFGVAYLIERWASRFVGELFNHSTVLFLGYSADDPGAVAL